MYGAGVEELKYFAKLFRVGLQLSITKCYTMYYLQGDETRSIFCHINVIADLEHFGLSGHCLVGLKRFIRVHWITFSVAPKFGKQR